MGIIFVNNVLGSLSATIDPVKIDFGVMSQPEGLAFFEKLKAQGSGSTDVTKEVIASFGDGPAPFLNPAGGSTSLFSSYGLDNELHIKPVSTSKPFFPYILVSLLMLVFVIPFGYRLGPWSAGRKHLLHLVMMDALCTLLLIA